MLGRIRVVLGYLDWLGVIAFLTVFGILAWERNIWAGIAIFAAAVFMCCVMIAHTSPRYSPQNRVGTGKPIGTPLIDIGLLAIFSSTLIFEADGIDKSLQPFFWAGFAMNAIDLLLWCVIWLKQFTSRKDGMQ